MGLPTPTLPSRLLQEVMSGLDTSFGGVEPWGCQRPCRVAGMGTSMCWAAVQLAQVLALSQTRLGATAPTPYPSSSADTSRSVELREPCLLGLLCVSTIRDRGYS